MKKVWLVTTALAIGAPAHAQQATTIRDVVVGVGQVLADGRLRREVAAVSQPLTYDSSLPAQDSEDRSDPRNMDLAGLRLGMSAADARRALQQAGYSIADERKEYSYAMRVFPHRNGNMAQDVREWGANGRNGQQLNVKFASLPQGAVLDTVEFRVSTEAMSEEAFIAQLGSKYGEADLVGDGELVWCVGPAGQCSDDWRAQPHLLAEPGSRALYLKFVDPARDQALEARVQSVLDGRKRKLERADF